MKNLGVVITDGVGYRNFILSNFIRDGGEDFHKIIIFSFLPKSVYEGLGLECEIIEMDVLKENFFSWLFKKAKEVTHLQMHSKKNPGIRSNLQAAYFKSNTPRGFAARFIFKWSKTFKSESWIYVYNVLQQQSFRSRTITKNYFKLLKKHKVSILFFTHQRPPYIAPLIFAAERLKIKTSVFIFSWDNLSSKGRMAGNFNYYLVWSDLMRNELLKFYKRLDEKQISVVGTPQFEPYVLDKYGFDKEKTFRLFNLDLNKPLILFTCNDSSSENDPLYLEILAGFIRERKLCKEVNLVVRTSPAEEPERFRKISENYSFINWNYPKWEIKRKKHQEDWSQRVPSIEDIHHLKSLLKHSCLVINVLSTITLDSYFFNKPVINPVFGNNENELYNDQKFLSYGHLEKLVHSGSSHIVKNKEEFLHSLNSVLSGMDDKEEKRNDFLNLQIGQPLLGTSERIIKQLLRWS